MINIAVVGMGLIGGSMCRAIKKYTDNKCFGYDRNSSVIEKGLKENVIDAAICDSDFCNMDLTIVALHPVQSIEFILANKDKFKKGSIVMDVCGIKKAMVDAVSDVLKDACVSFIGTHPMAGREFSGFDYSLADLFSNASMILTPKDYIDKQDVDTVRDLCKKIGFKKIVISTPEEHDRIIAFTSQLAHVVSSAYIKSPSAREEYGFSAGSYQDLTRVAMLNENMWTDLFLLNGDALTFEIDNIIAHLKEYRDAISENNSDRLKSLLKDGRILKEEDIKKRMK